MHKAAPRLLRNALAVSYEAPLEDIVRVWKRNGLSIDRPGFYDHPSYVRAAQSQPDYINTYARYVRDQPYTEGYLARWTAQFAGLGGSVRYIRNRVTGVMYYPIGTDFIGSLSGAGGIVFGLDDDVRLIDRFFLGGTSLRGFANFGVGPRDVAADADGFMVTSSRDTGCPDCPPAYDW